MPGLGCEANDMADFYGLSFDTDYSLFGDEFEDLPGVYVIYTETKCLDIGQTDKLKTAIEAHPNTRTWVLSSNGEEIYIAFHLDIDQESRVDKKGYLRAKMKPIL